MKRISNYHSHVALCGHAEGTVEDYVKEAIKHNFEEIGISDHAPIPVYFVGEKMHYDLWLSHMMNRETFETEAFKNQGGFKKVNAAFGNKLDLIIDEINDALYCA